MVETFVNRKDDLRWILMLPRQLSGALMGLCQIKGNNPGGMIPSAGQEAAGPAVCGAPESGDMVIGNHVWPERMPEWRT